MKVLVAFLWAILAALAQEVSEELEEKLGESLCELQCLQKPYNSCESYKCNCFQNTNKSHDLVYVNSTETPHLELLCRDETVLAFKWDFSLPSIYLLEIRNKSSVWKFFNKTICKRIAIDGLTPNTSYQIRLWTMTESKKVLHSTPSPWIRTALKNRHLGDIETFNTTGLTFMGDSFTATMKWDSQDPGCFYNLVYFYDEDGFPYPVNHDIKKTKDLFEVRIPDLQLGKQYNMAIAAVSEDRRRRGAKTWHNITITPSCLDIFNNLSVCVPPSPESVETEETIYEDSFELQVSWQRPSLTPDYYTVEVLLKNGLRPSQNATGNATRVVFKNLSLAGDYHVLVTAFSEAGGSEPTIVSKELNVTNIISAISTTYWSNSTQITIFASLGVILGLVVFILLMVYRRCRLKKINETMVTQYYSENYNEKNASNLTTEYYIPDLVEDEWEINPEDVTLDAYIDEGAFGVVHKGYYRRGDGSQLQVAVKMLKGNPSSEEIRQFEHEISIMKSVGSHPHLVSFLGCCSRIGRMGPFLVVEYCDKGALQAYLRKIWEHICGGTLEESSEHSQPRNFSNRVYDLFDDTLLEPRDLLSFARQIAMGMEYLSNLRVVHRDLATRNVLMCGNRTVKVADFGLSRDVYQDNIYTKIGAGKLPVKWMALESLTHQRYTTQSDVWSYGITLWEIVTLGGNPYSTIPTQELLTHLRNGYRMERPKNCSAELYQMMRSCWREVPKERPTFTELHKMLEKLLESENRYINLDVRF